MINNNNKRSITWGTKIIQEYNPDMQRRSQVRPSLKLSDNQNNISFGEDNPSKIPRKKSAFKQSDR